MSSGEISRDKIRMSLVIPKELKSQLEAYARNQDRSTNKIIEYSIREYLYNHTATEPAAETVPESDTNINELAAAEE